MRIHNARILKPILLGIFVAVLAPMGKHKACWAQTQQFNVASGQDLIGFLNRSIEWYRQLTVEDRADSNPGDILLVDDDRQTALEILELSFEFARADAQALAAQGAGQAALADAPIQGRYAALSQAAQKAANEVQQDQSALEADRRKLETAHGAVRQKLQAEIDELQAALNLAEARNQTIHNILQFMNGASGTAGNLGEQIDQLQHSVPELQAAKAKSGAQNGATGTKNVSPTPATTSKERSSGILGLVEDLFGLSERIHIIDQRTQQTDELAQAAKNLRAPLVANLTDIVHRGEEIAKQTGDDDPAQLEQLKKDLDAMTATFRHSSEVVLPLTKQSVLFDLYKSNLTRWRTLLKTEYSASLRALLIRLAIFGVVLALVIILARVWRRAVFRYVHDARRRYQFLLLRRIVLWCAIAITIAFALATEIGSIATFAGLITAGIAVALQNVIMAVAGYFFLIGRYGVKVGDRVQISGVTGDVIDIGLIRLHLMEIGGPETDRQVTGRVVVFSNAVVFQPTASFYKQIPGTSFVWHQVTLTLVPEDDYTLAEKRILGAVEKVYSEYKEAIEKQHRHMQHTLNFNVPLPEPRSRLRLTQTGLEVVVRYPVELNDATEIDDHVTRELLHSLDQHPRLRLVGTGTPNIQPAPDDPKAAHAP